MFVISQEYKRLAKENEEKFKYLNEINLWWKSEKQVLIILMGKEFQLLFGVVT